MVLIGMATQAVQKKQWAALTKLATGFLDVVDGLSTLTIFGRQYRQVARIDRVTEDYRARTMAVLRISFVSGFVLELAGSLSVAVVAVSIGLRLVDGTLGLTVGLFVLLLTPEAYLPLRQVGLQFHAAADGVAAADEVFEILDSAPVAAAASSVVPVSTRPGTLAVDDLTVRYGDRTVVDGLSVRFEPGVVTAIAGPSGAGKSSLVAAVLGFVPFTGTVSFDGQALEPEAARELVAWSGQRPSLMAGTVVENIALGSAPADERTLREAMRYAVAELIDPAQLLGVGGEGLSGGQAQRVSLARAFYRAIAGGQPVLILDEPTSALDAATEAELILGLKRFAATGVAVVVVSHRTAVLDSADSVIELRPRVAVGS